MGSSLRSLFWLLTLRILATALPKPLSLNIMSSLQQYNSSLRNHNISLDTQQAYVWTIPLLHF